MSIKTLLHFQALSAAENEAHQIGQKLQAFLSMDSKKVEAELRDGLAHFEGEVVRLKGLIPARVLAHVAEGARPDVAVQMADAGVMTQAEYKAAAANDAAPSAPAA